MRVFGRFHSFEREKIVKTVNLKIGKFSFPVYFSKMSSRRQAKVITIYRIPGFSFSSPSVFNAIHAFNLRFHISRKRIAIILLPIFDKLQFVVSKCQKASQGTIS